jgi:hypothetical protein
LTSWKYDEREREGERESVRERQTDRQTDKEIEIPKSDKETERER